MSVPISREYNIVIKYNAIEMYIYKKYIILYTNVDFADTYTTGIIFVLIWKDTGAHIRFYISVNIDLLASILVFLFADTCVKRFPYKVIEFNIRNIIIIWKGGNVLYYTKLEYYIEIRRKIKKKHCSQSNCIHYILYRCQGRERNGSR